jgi:serine/threonine protein phosphatase PrpC
MIKPTSMRLPNGNATRAYSAALGSVLKIPLERLEWLDPWPAGLSLSEQGSVAGTPEVAGEYVVRWRRVGESIVEGEFLLTINADPRSLWKDLPSDRSDPFWKEDSDKKQGGSAVANVVAASVRGRSHAHVGSFRDDDFAMHLPLQDDPFGWHLLCVADGAGGSKSSRRGSQVACNVIIEKLKELLVDSPEGMAAELDARSREAEESEKADSAFWTRTLYHVLGTAVGHAQAAVRKEADALGVSIKEFSTTLLVSIVRRTTKNAWFVGTYWVGDGAIGMWSPEWAAPKLFGEPETGEYAGQTTFFTSEDLSRAETVQKRLRYTLVQDFGFLALMTDGISDPKFPTEQMLKMPAAWATFQEDINAVLTALAPGEPNTDQQLLDWMDFWSAGNHDDRTLLLLVPRAAEVETN